MCPMLPVSLDCAFLITQSVFSNVYILITQTNQTMERMLHVSSDILKGGHQVQHYIKFKKKLLVEKNP